MQHIHGSCVFESVGPLRAVLFGLSVSDDTSSSPRIILDRTETLLCTQPDQQHPDHPSYLPLSHARPGRAPNPAGCAVPLLPLLIADGSAAAVALTCSSLRRLVHGSRQRLDLTSLSRHDDPNQVAAWAAEAAQHFPACTAVKCAVLQDSDFLLVQNIMPALARQVKPPFPVHTCAHACMHDCLLVVHGA